jgi:hypothetical protein
MSKRLITTMSMVSALAAAVAVPAAAGEGGPPQGGGGCHMVFSSSGLTNMMAGSAHGEGAANMVDMLSRFSQLPFCGV